MRKFCMVLLAATVMATPAMAQKGCSLDTALALLDRSSEGFKSVKTTFEWDQYQAVVAEHDLNRGTMYFLRVGPNVEVAADVEAPVYEKKTNKLLTWEPQKKMLFKDGLLQILFRRTGQITTKDARKDQANFENFLALGFGGRGHDLPKNFTVRCAGTETAMGVPTYKLELVPKTQQARNMFPLITLWINQQTGMSVQQKLDQGEGDYRLAKYANIELNKPLPADAFVLKK